MENAQNSEDQYQQLFETHPHATVVYDSETLRVVAVNRAAVALYGYSREEFLKLSIGDVLSSGNTPVSGMETESGAHEHRRKDGSAMLLQIDWRDVSFDGRRAKLLAAHAISSPEGSRNDDQQPVLDSQLR